ncbi:hypothetical protein [uncultured Clostridium sp.]|uniref:hypothetical protein n=1 Tax=uncultured Clostridium sp. TaxID=59620 RepID=UPI002632AB07|nr:hypothetical protein [uncultured Clostridium sp.]
MKLNSMIKKRIKTFFIFLPLPIIAIILIFLTLNHTILSGLDHRGLHELTKNVGFYGIFIFIIQIALFVFRLLMKYSTPRGITKIDTLLSKVKITIPTKIKEKYLISKYLDTAKSIFMWFAKLMQKIHIPLSILGTSVIGYHVYLAFHMGWIWSVGYIFGLIAAVFLLIITLSGITRMFNKNIKTHKYLMFGFVIFTALHILFI